MTFPELFYKWFLDDQELSDKFLVTYSPKTDYCSIASKDNRTEYAYAGYFNAYAKLIIDAKTHYLDNTAGLWIHGVGMLLPSDPEFFNKVKDILFNQISKIAPLATYFFAPYIPLQTLKP